MNSIGTGERLLIFSIRIEAEYIRYLNIDSVIINLINLIHLNNEDTRTPEA